MKTSIKYFEKKKKKSVFEEDKNSLPETIFAEISQKLSVDVFIYFILAFDMW